MRNLLVLALLVPAIGLTARQAIFRSDVDVVRIDALVTDDGRVIKGLGAEDFDVFDSKVSQKIDLISSVNLPVNVVLGLDVSHSIDAGKYAGLREASDAMVGALTAEDQVGLVTFGSRATLRASLTRDVDRVKLALDQPTTSAETALIDAGFAAITAAGAESGRALVVLFTDGVDTSSILRADTVRGFARRADVVVYGVAPADARVDPFLDDLAEQTGGRILRTTSNRQVAIRLTSILEEFRQRYVLSFRPEGVPANGWHPLTVRLKKRRGSVTARPGYER